MYEVAHGTLKIPEILFTQSDYIIDIQSTNKVIRMKQQFYRHVRRAYEDALDGVLLSMNGDVVLQVS